MEGQISMQKRSEMPYTCAFMEEVFRFRTLVPLGLQHALTEDAKLGEYVLPKGTIVSGNSNSILGFFTLFAMPLI